LYLIKAVSGPLKDCIAAKKAGQAPSPFYPKLIWVLAWVTTLPVVPMATLGAERPTMANQLTHSFPGTFEPSSA